MEEETNVTFSDDRESLSHLRLSPPAAGGECSFTIVSSLPLASIPPQAFHRDGVQFD